MASPFDRLMTTIRPHLPGALDDAIRQELFQTCTDFFKWSDAWQEDIEFEVEQGAKDGEVMPFAGRIERLMGVSKDERPIRGAILGTPDSSGVFPIHMRHGVDAGTYVAKVSLNVSDPVSRDAFPIVPSEIVTRYTAELICGILARMMAQPSKPYTNLPLAQFNLRQFRGGASRAKNAVRTGNTDKSQAWTFPRNFVRRK